ncbi:polysaccharide pyruvyl transferase family protein [Vibrio campbellii]|uniref:polysaccharide pyruvyl transferase family protein n=1 Tax=Vibrio campbellii TaxID=680 RepID=UPI000A9A535A|nr:polysaccharide pyruvyl transferase family protein [Vibrio campbellii]
MKKVLLVNRGTCNNLGDQAINVAFEKFINNEIGCDVICEDYTSKSKNVNAINAGQQVSPLKGFLKKILPLNLIWFVRNYNRIKKCIDKNLPDLIVVGGGQLLLHGRFSVAAFTWVYLAKKRNKKIVFSNVGYGGSYSWLEGKLINWAVNNADGINFRDKSSSKMIDELYNVKSVVSGDVVFTEKALTLCPEKQTLIALGITARSVYNMYNATLEQSEYYNLWLDFLKKNDISISNVVLTYTTQEDSVECELFKEHIKRAHDVDLDILYNKTLDDYKSNLESVSLVISGRMHGLILAINSGCRVITFPISNKLKSFDEIINSEDLIEFRERTKKETIKFINSYL